MQIYEVLIYITAIISALILVIIIDMFSSHIDKEDKQFIKTLFIACGIVVSCLWILYCGGVIDWYLSKF